jgi:hypothetical protein
LRHDLLDCIYYNDCAINNSKGSSDFAREIYMPWRVNKVYDVGFALGFVEQADVRSFRDFSFCSSSGNRFCCASHRGEAVRASNRISKRGLP